MAKEDVLNDLQRKISLIEQESPKAECVSAKSKLRLATSETQGGHRDAEEAFRKILGLVNVSDRSEKTIRERLGRAGFTPDAIDESVNRAISYGIIDDIRYGSVYVRSQLARGKGIDGITYGLRKQDIDISSIPGWPEEFDVDESSEVNRALEVLERRPPRSKNMHEGAFRKLVGKGYSVAVASKAARLWCDSKGT